MKKAVMSQSAMKLVLMLLALCFLLLFVVPAFATNGSPVSDMMTVYDPAGNIYAQVSATEADEVANGASFI